MRDMSSTVETSVAVDFLRARTLTYVIYYFVGVYFCAVTLPRATSSIRSSARNGCWRRRALSAYAPFPDESSSSSPSSSSSSSWALLTATLDNSCIQARINRKEFRVCGGKVGPRFGDCID